MSRSQSIWRSLAQLPPRINAAVYFICAGRSPTPQSTRQPHVTVKVRSINQLNVEVADDGIGGADLSRGSGLNGLADRIATVGGKLHIEKRRRTRTRLVAEIPLGDEAGRPDLCRS